MDTIRVKNLKIPARHGVYDFEKDKDGLFELDIELKLELKKPGHSDRLEDTINYNDLEDQLKLSNSSLHLLYTLQPGLYCSPLIHFLII